MYIEYNQQRYEVSEAATEMSRDEKRMLNRSWQTQKLGGQKAMSYIDKKLPKFISVALAECDYDFNSYVQWMRRYISSKDLCELADMMAVEWMFDKDLCMRYIMCNLFNQFPVGLRVEARFAEQFEHIKLYDNSFDFMDEIDDTQLDFSYGIDFAAEIDGKFAAVQVKSIEDFDEALRDFKAQYKTRDKINLLKQSCKTLEDDQGRKPVALMVYVRRDNGETLYEWL